MSDKSKNDNKNSEQSSESISKSKTSDKISGSEQDIRITTSVKPISYRARRKRIDPNNETNVLPEDGRRLQRLLANQEENYGTMSLGDKQEIILLIRGMVERVIMEVGTTYKLGRFEIGAAADTEIDMTPYGAQDRGVSRHHADLEILENIVHLIDRGSTNGTFVNGTKLKPNSPHPLRKGDEIILGRLTVQILFR